MAREIYFVNSVLESPLVGREVSKTVPNARSKGLSGSAAANSYSRRADTERSRATDKLSGLDFFGVFQSGLFIIVPFLTCENYHKEWR